MLLLRSKTLLRPTTRIVCTYRNTLPYARRHISTEDSIITPAMQAVKNTIAENFGGRAQGLASGQMSVDDVPDLSGKVAVVTGGSEGIGYGVSCTSTLPCRG